MVQNFKKLTSGHIDYFVSGDYLGRAYLSGQKDLERQLIVTLEPPVSDDFIYFGFSRKSPCLGILPQMNNRLAELNKQGVSLRLLNDSLEQFSQRRNYPW